MYNPNYLKAILIYVRDKDTGYTHIVGTDQHDRLYLDDSGNIQYLNLQNGGSTECDYEFVLDEQGHNQSNLTFTKEEQEKYGLSNMDDYFNSIDLAYKLGKCLKYDNCTEYCLEKDDTKEIINHRCERCLYEHLSEHEEPCAHCTFNFKPGSVRYNTAKDYFKPKGERK